MPEPADAARVPPAFPPAPPGPEALLPAVYAELRRIARRHRRGESDALTIQTTEIVHEAFLRLAGSAVAWASEGHFLAVASRAMRRLLVDRARARRRLRRSGGAPHVPLDAAPTLAERPREDLLIALDEALDILALHHPDMARVVEARFFGGLTSAQTAEALGLSLRTTERLWTRARAHLHGLLLGDALPGA